jgi:hypothetical protein
VNLHTFTSSLQSHPLPVGWSVYVDEKTYGPGRIYGRTIYKDNWGYLHYDHPDSYLNSKAIDERLILLSQGKNPDLGDLKTYEYPELRELHEGLTEERNKDLSEISNQMSKIGPTPTNQDLYNASNYGFLPSKGKIQTGAVKKISDFYPSSQ